MIKNITRKVLREVEETVSSVGICDICGKEFNYKPRGKEKIASYYHIRTGHYDWGNDSCESVENRDACCDECLSRFTQEWLKDADVIDSDSAYIEIHKDLHVLEETDNEVRKGCAE
jgi:hypothetical protein